MLGSATSIILSYTLQYEEICSSLELLSLLIYLLVIEAVAEDSIHV